MSTHSDTTRRTDRRTDREELETDAPLCPDLGSLGADPNARFRRELAAIREQLDRIERRMEAER